MDEIDINEESVVEEVEQVQEEVQAEPVIDEEIGVEVEAEAPVEEQYAPDYSYTVHDEKHEFDEWVREAIKNKEHEESLRELYTRANGLPIVKEKYSDLQKQVDETYKPQIDEYNNQNQVLQHLGKLKDNKEYKRFFDELGIPKQEILEYALKEAEYQEMDPQQRAYIDNEYNSKLQAEQLRSQNEYYEQQLQQQQVQARTLQLDNELARPDVVSFSQTYDSQVGRPGAFREKVIEQGQLAWYTQQRDAPVNELVGQVMGMFPGFAQQVQQQQPAPQAQPQVVASREEKPVIPNIQGKSSSPAKKQINSIADLKKLSQRYKQA